MPSSMQALTTQTSSEGESWIIDTGASHHMSPDVTFLKSTVPYTGDKKIIVRNGEELNVQHVGTGTIKTHSHTLHLKNILHVPILTVNLLL